MKKVMVILIVATFLAPAGGFATDLDGVDGFDFQMSNQVIGSYFDNGVDPATGYQISTGHLQGNRIYATGSDESQVFFKASDGDTVVSGDLLTDFDAEQLASGDTWEAL